MGFPGGACQCRLDERDTGSIPGLGRSLAGGHGNPFQYSGLENPMDRGAWQGILSMGSQRVRHDWVTNTQALYHCRLWPRDILCYERSPAPGTAYSFCPVGLESLATQTQPCGHSMSCFQIWGALGPATGPQAFCPLAVIRCSQGAGHAGWNSCLLLAP